MANAEEITKDIIVALIPKLVLPPDIVHDPKVAGNYIAELYKIIHKAVIESNSPKTQDQLTV
jgi:hypothetical protein